MSADDVRTRQHHRKRAMDLLAMTWRKDTDGSYTWNETSRREILKKAEVHALLALSADITLTEEP